MTRSYLDSYLIHLKKKEASEALPAVSCTNSEEVHQYTEWQWHYIFCSHPKIGWLKICSAKQELHLQRSVCEVLMKRCYKKPPWLYLSFLKGRTLWIIFTNKFWVLVMLFFFFRVYLWCLRKCASNELVPWEPQSPPVLEEPSYMIRPSQLSLADVEAGTEAGVSIL